MKKIPLLTLIMVLLLQGIVALVSGEAWTTGGGFTYVLLPDGTAEITAYSASESDLLIPPALDGHPVTGIGPAAFSWQEDIRSLSLPESLLYIGENAFVNCTGLTEVVIPDSVLRIGAGAFTGCDNLERVVIGRGVEAFDGNPFIAAAKLLSIQVAPDHPTLSVADGALVFKPQAQLMFYPTGLKETTYTVPEGILSIADGAFYGAKRLKSVALPEGLLSIGDNAFTDCTALTDMPIPDSVALIGSAAFMGCERLTSLVIPDGVSVIGDETFASCIRLKSVTLPQNLTSIGAAAFALCESLGSLRIPGSVASIGRDAFAGCEKLTIVLLYDSFAQAYAQENGLKYKLQ